MASLEPFTDSIIDLFQNGMTYADISANLAEMGVQNCSSMSVLAEEEDWYRTLTWNWQWID